MFGRFQIFNLKNYMKNSVYISFHMCISLWEIPRNKIARSKDTCISNFYVISPNYFTGVLSVSTLTSNIGEYSDWFPNTLIYALCYLAFFLYLTIIEVKHNITLTFILLWEFKSFPQIFEGHLLGILSSFTFSYSIFGPFLVDL